MFLWKKHIENVHQTLVPGSNNSKQPFHEEILLKIRYFERELSKSVKEVNFIFSSKPIPF